MRQSCNLAIRAGFVLLLVGCSVSCSSPRTVPGLLEAANKAMGTVTSLRYSGKGFNGNYGQALQVGLAWPRREALYAHAINYTQKSSSEVWKFAEPVIGGQTQNLLVNGDKAWTVSDADPTPKPSSVEAQQLAIWMTPHGFLKAAASAKDATMSLAGGDGATIMFTPFVAPDKYRFTGHFDAAHLLTSVETKVADPVLGDTALVAKYSDYKDFGGIQFPQHIVIEQGGSPVADLNIDKVELGLQVYIPVPEAISDAQLPKIVVKSSELARGVWLLAGGTYHSVAVEFKDFSVVIEAPQSDERARAVIAETKRLIPNRPIRYVVTTHHHFDHIGGLRTFVAEGSTIITDASNIVYYSNAFKTSATIEPDTLARTPKPPVAKFNRVDTKYLITDGVKTLEVYPLKRDSHTNELLMAYLRQERILVEADTYSPQDPKAQPIPTPVNALNLYENIRRLNLDVKTIAPIHGRGAVPMQEFLHFIGK